MLGKIVEERLSGGRSQREGAKKGKAWEKVRLGPQVAGGFKKKRGWGQNEWEDKVCVGRIEKEEGVVGSERRLGAGRKREGLRRKK